MAVGNLLRKLQNRVPISNPCDATRDFSNWWLDMSIPDSRNRSFRAEIESDVPEWSCLGKAEMNRVRWRVIFDAVVLGTLVLLMIYFAIRG